MVRSTPAALAHTLFDDTPCSLPAVSDLDSQKPRQGHGVSHTPTRTDPQTRAKSHKYDAYNLVVAGLRGGKDVPVSVTAHLQLFVTLTAPSFGPVHLGPDKAGNPRPCKPRRDATGCRRFHPAGDPLIGTPIDPASYDYTGHVLFNAPAGKLWSLTTTEIRRSLARLAGLTRAALGDCAAVTFAKVAEYQARGVIHFHAVIRLDGPDGPSSAPPPWATADLLKRAVRDGATRATVTAPASRALGEPAYTWGTQLDVKHVTPAALGATGQLTDVTVARYIAKYATKSAESAGVELPPMACRSCSGTGRTAEHHPDRPVFHHPCGSCGGHGRTLDLDDNSRILLDQRPKSDAGQRTVAFPAQLVPVLQTHLAAHVADEPGAYVFTSATGLVLRRANFRRYWVEAVHAAGLKDIRFHDLRHTGATIAAQTGATLKELMTRIGHSSPNAALGYQHAGKGRDREIASALGKLISDEMTKTQDSENSDSPEVTGQT